MGQQQEAVRHLQESIRFDPSRETSYLALADVFEKAEQFPTAVEVLERGRRALPHAEALLLPLGIDLVRAERNQEGLALLRDVVLRTPDNDQAYLNMATASATYPIPAANWMPSAPWNCGSRITRRSTCSWHARC